MSALELLAKMDANSKAKGNSPKDRKKTKKGAVHTQGNHFLGRRVLKVTPAQYRHMHMANPKKHEHETMMENKRKWISA